ncbi:MAG TPA: hypothetical protein VI796_01725 [Candidatus Thermoplasmatota archaeon]|nr:hypothetical protein [Candidatus Thermoplasmatota archaeon]
MRDTPPHATPQEPKTEPPMLFTTFLLALFAACTLALVALLMRSRRTGDEHLPYSALAALGAALALAVLGFELLG